jgi:hypothetical protein
VWFTKKLLQQYTSLKFLSGTGSSSFADACNAAAAVFDATTAAEQLTQGPAGLGALPTINPW